MIGKTVSHYKIVEKLGEGGMGIVYKAEDTRLGRIVALKFLPEHRSGDPAAKTRFEQEAKGASAISHPNITAIHDIFEADDQSFIVMEYVDGKTLKALLKENLSVRPILDLAIQTAEGLAAAHKKGIVHRDIKSENVMVDANGVVKIMDFGLAKLKGAPKLTQTGSSVGTVAYMSPEQTQGEGVDQRSDLFSFGVILYELVAGKLPFEGEHPAAVSYAICYNEPEPLARFNAQLPEGLQRAIDKCLKKDKSLRYQSAEELLADLRGLKLELDSGRTVVSPKRRVPVRYFVFAGLGIFTIAAAIIVTSRFFQEGKIKPMLAVLPFRNLGPPDEEHFADGITDEITTNLARVSGLLVISNTSAIRYKGTDKTNLQIGKELGVDNLLRGTVNWERSGNARRVKINSYLIAVKGDTHIWVDSYERVYGQIFELQSEIAKEVTSELKIKLLPKEQMSLERKPTDNLEAYDYYLLGNEYFRRHGREDLPKAVEMYEKAIALDSNFALAYGLLARAHVEMYWSQLDRSEERLRAAKTAADKAFQIEPALAEAHFALGDYYYHGRMDYEVALKKYELALKNQPSNKEVLTLIGAVKRRQGKWEESARFLQKASDLDPLSLDGAFNAAVTLANVRRFPEAELYVNRAIRLAPELHSPHFLKYRLLLAANGNTKKAREVLEQASASVGPDRFLYDWIWLDILDGRYQQALTRIPKMGSDTMSYLMSKARIYELMRDTGRMRAYYDSARLILEKRIKKEDQEASAHIFLGVVYAGLGRKQEAIQEGKKAAEELKPVSKDALDGPGVVKQLAQIYVMVGEYDKAVDRLEYLLSIPSEITIPYLRIDPTWTPLRNHPRFQKLLKRDKS